MQQQQQRSRQDVHQGRSQCHEAVTAVFLVSSFSFSIPSQPRHSWQQILISRPWHCTGYLQGEHCSSQHSLLPSRSFLLRFLHLLHAIHLQWLWDLQWKLSALKFHCQPYNLSINADTKSGSACNQSCAQTLYPIMLAATRALLVACQRVGVIRN